MITIEFSFAWLLSLIMVVGIVTVLTGIIFKNDTCVGLGLVFLIGGDLGCIVGSLTYRSHPTNGDEVGRIGNAKGCSTYDWKNHTYCPMVECIAPTPEDNPYEQQPLHPLTWMWGGIVILGDALTGAISLKVT
jgi:hypothetical protein